MLTKQNAPASSLLAQGANQNTRRNLTSLSPRLHRLATALLVQPRTVRQLIDILPSNNPAEYVRQLRESYGLTILCEHVKFTTVDGDPSWFGVYHLTPSDRERLGAKCSEVRL